MDEDDGHFSIGPFDFETVQKRVTLRPGVYTFTKPVTFGIEDVTVVDGLYYEGESLQLRNPE